MDHRRGKGSGEIHEYGLNSNYNIQDEGNFNNEGYGTINHKNI